jgi:hypothetical protein
MSWTSNACAVAALASVMMGCASTPAPVAVTVVLRAQAEANGDVRDALVRGAPAGIAANVVLPPSGASTGGDDASPLEARLLAARKAYLAADASRCIEELGDAQALGPLLERGHRALVARLLFWRSACAVAAGENTDAKKYATTLGVLGLDMPDDISRASVEVESLVLGAAREVRAQAPVPVEFRSNVLAAELRVDGKGTACASPCRLSLAPGTHWITASAPGSVPATKRVEVARGAQVVSLELQPAGPALAGEQWAASFAGGNAAESPDGMRLLATAMRARRVVYLQATPGPTASVRGTLFVDDGIRARAEQRADATSLPTQSTRVLNDLLHEGNVVETTPLYRRPLFWVIVGVTAAAASVGTYAALKEPPERTEVTFR